MVQFRPWTHYNCGPPTTFHLPTPLYEQWNTIPPQNHHFWQQKSIHSLYAVYLALYVSAQKLLDLIEEPILTHPNEQRVFGYTWKNMLVILRLMKCKNCFALQPGAESVPVAKLLCLLMLFLGWHSPQLHTLVFANWNYLPRIQHTWTSQLNFQ